MNLKRIKTNVAYLSSATRVITTLQQFGIDGIPLAMKPHKLKGKYINNWECHIKPDLLII
ncbi:MAG: hypothetical protein COB81_01305 [Flavobacteriaceae bacterium]|nr:MAG: hypothetical protein COB81_01305 [Flavobacteriaceae bacterium]